MTSTIAPPVSGRRPVPVREEIGDPVNGRVLTIPPLSGRIEKAVMQALEALKAEYLDDVDKAEAAIESHGLTIEVIRLRDRLHRSLRSDLQRVLLSTPGVTESLFNEAIAAQLEDEEKAGTAVKDESVLSVGAGIASASTSLADSLAAINESTMKFQESTAAIVATLEKVAKALEGHPEDEDPYPAPQQSGPNAPKAQADKGKGSTS